MSSANEIFLRSVISMEDKFDDRPRPAYKPLAKPEPVKKVEKDITQFKPVKNINTATLEREYITPKTGVLITTKEGVHLDEVWEAANKDIMRTLETPRKPPRLAKIPAFRVLEPHKLKSGAVYLEEDNILVLPRMQ